MAEKTRRKVSWPIKLLLIAGSIILALAVGEFLVRLVAPQQTFAICNTPWGFGHVKDFKMRHLGDNGNFVWVRYNNFGLRERDLVLEKPPGVFRILVFGDSWVEDLGSVAENLMTRHLERLLNRAGLGCRVQVINFGHYAFSNAQELMFFLKVGKYFKPDLVIVVYAWDMKNNTLLATIGADANLQLLWQKHTWWQNLTRDIRTFFRSRSHLAILVFKCLSRIHRFLGGEAAPKKYLYLTLPEDHPNIIKLKQLLMNDPIGLKNILDLILPKKGYSKRPIMTTRLILRRFKSEVQRIGAKFLMVNCSKSLEDTTITRIYRQEGIDYMTVDLTPYRQELERQKASHYNPRRDSDRWGYGGNEIAARQICKKLILDKLVPVNRATQRPAYFTPGKTLPRAARPGSHGQPPRPIR